MAAPLFESKFFKVIKRTPEYLTILSASDQGVTFGPDSSLGHTFNAHSKAINIFSEIVTLRGQTSNKTYSLGTTTADIINLCCTDLSVTGPGKAIVSSRGRDGIPNDGAVSTARDATNGTKGRELNVFIGEAPLSELPVIFDARGGNGATTNTLTEKAGSGGGGGSITLFLNTIWGPIYEQLDKLQTDHQLPEDFTSGEERAAQPLSSDDGRLSQARGIVRLLSRTVPESDSLYPRIWPIVEGLVTKEPPTLFSLARTINHAVKYLKSAMEEQRTRLKWSSDAAGGLGGQATITKGGRGLNGDAGLSLETPVQVIMVPEHPCTPPKFAIVHPVQCQMLLEKARAYFYFGDDASREQAKKILTSLSTKLALVLDHDSKYVSVAMDGYTQQREALGVETSMDIVSSLEQIRKEALSMLFQLTCTSVDYYSLRQDWVPRTSVTQFKTETENSILRLEKIEKLYLQYTEALSKGEKVESIRKQALTDISAAEASVLKDEEDLRHTLRDLSGKIQDLSLQQAINAKNRELDFQLTQLQDDVTFNFSISPKSLKAAIITVAKEPSKGTLGEEAGGLVWQGFTAVPDEKGVPIDKSLLLEQLVNVSRDLNVELKDLGDNPATGNDGQLELNPNGGKILLATAEQIEKFCTDFGSSSGKALSERAQLTRDLMREYVKLVTGRNSDIVQYNIVLKAILSSRANRKALNERSLAISNQVFDRPDQGQLDQMSKMIDDMYTYTRTRTMRLLSFYRRSIHFSALSNPDLVQIGGFKNDAALSLGCTKLSDIKGKLSDTFFDMNSQKALRPPRFPADFQKGEGKFVDLSDAQLAELKKRGPVFVTIPAVSRGSTVPQDFRGAADVRVYCVRFWLDGLRVRPEHSNSSSSDRILVKIDLIHHGDSVIYDVNNDQHAFTHDTIDVPWSYYYAPGADSRKASRLKIVDSGTIIDIVKTDDGEANMTYAAPSPFATWSLSLEDLDDRLDVSSVTKGRFEFFGTSRVFKRVTKPVPSASSA